MGDAAPLIILAFSLGLAGAAFKIARLAIKAQASMTWPSVEGRITRSEVGTDHTHGRARIYVPRIEYEFEARGRTHRGECIAFQGAVYTSWPDRAEAKCREYPVAATVDVYYDPADPASSCLEPPVRTPVVGFATSGLLGAAALAGLGLLVGG